MRLPHAIDFLDPISVADNNLGKASEQAMDSCKRFLSHVFPQGHLHGVFGRVRSNAQCHERRCHAPLPIVAVILRAFQGIGLIIGVLSAPGVSEPHTPAPAHGVRRGQLGYMPTVIQTDLHCLGETEHLKSATVWTRLAPGVQIDLHGIKGRPALLKGAQACFPSRPPANAL